jgi:hypothetical protein
MCFSRKAGATERLLEQLHEGIGSGHKEIYVYSGGWDEAKALMERAIDYLQRAGRAVTRPDEAEFMITADGSRITFAKPMPLDRIIFDENGQPFVGCKVIDEET